MAHSEDNPCREAGEAPKTVIPESASATANISKPGKTTATMERKPAALLSSVKSGASNAARYLTKGPATRQLAIGALSGWTTGFLAIRVGKPIAITVGGSIILFQLAHQQGYIKTDWQNLKLKLEKTAEGINPNMKRDGPKMLTRAQTFAKGNSVFAAGFIGGFLIGLAS